MRDRQKNERASRQADGHQIIFVRETDTQTDRYEINESETEIQTVNRSR